MRNINRSFILGLASLVFFTGYAVSTKPSELSKSIVTSAASSPTSSPSPTSTIEVLTEEKRIIEFDREPTASDYLDAGLGSPDADCDGIKNMEDNCPLNYNPKQKDRDMDGIGNVCDRLPKKKALESEVSEKGKMDKRCDTDKDGRFDDKDNCPLFCNPNQRDKNKDGVGDACEFKTAVINVCNSKL